MGRVVVPVKNPIKYRKAKAVGELKWFFVCRMEIIFLFFSSDHSRYNKKVHTPSQSEKNSLSSSKKDEKPKNPNKDSRGVVTSKKGSVSKASKSDNILKTISPDNAPAGSSLLEVPQPDNTAIKTASEIDLGVNNSSGSGSARNFPSTSEHAKARGDTKEKKKAQRYLLEQRNFVTRLVERIRSGESIENSEGGAPSVRIQSSFQGGSTPIAAEVNFALPENLIRPTTVETLSEAIKAAKAKLEEATAIYHDAIGLSVEEAEDARSFGTVHGFPFTNVQTFHNFFSQIERDENLFDRFVSIIAQNRNFKT